MCLAERVNAEARQIIATLGLAPLPQEGGFFRQTWRAAAGSAIVFLITEGEFSALHRLRSDEVWFFHAGDPVQHVMLDPRAGVVRETTLGPDLAAGHTPQLVVPGGVWQGAHGVAGGPRGWSLVGCSMAPAWAEKDFALGERTALQREFPGAAALVRALTR